MSARSRSIQLGSAFRVAKSPDRSGPRFLVEFYSMRGGRETDSCPITFIWQRGLWIFGPCGRNTRGARFAARTGLAGRGHGTAAS